MGLSTLAVSAKQRALSCRSLNDFIDRSPISSSLTEGHDHYSHAQELAIALGC
ncbi:hypothetical protein [Myxacorys almedinensis]|uniref:Uncharacterized protein n=1 Tax=Myxacorys almedinensis A TaxID=2690445 RepID=A0A8J8CLT1_9CYAN|nr:hypothetical protein [Myxacorys almedinensis]NDJ20016.1 hypothetical protein [Myxacorys almedinensis A]